VKSRHTATMFNTAQCAVCFVDKCDLPSGCKVQDFIVQENFHHSTVNARLQLSVLVLILLSFWIIILFVIVQYEFWVTFAACFTAVVLVSK